MGIVDSVKQALEKLAGEAQRKERQRAKEAEVLAQQAAKLPPLPSKTQKSNEPDREQIARERQERPGPAERVLPEHAARIRQAVVPQPQQVQRAAQEPAREATRMELSRDPQPEPSIGGMGTRFVNKRVAKRENLIDQVQRHEAERLSSMSPQQREAEQQARQRRVAREDLSRTIDNDHSQGRENGV